MLKASGDTKRNFKSFIERALAILKTIGSVNMRNNLQNFDFHEIREKKQSVSFVVYVFVNKATNH